MSTPTPCDYVEEEYAWWGWGTHENKENEWLGHGLFWRPKPASNDEPLDNMAGSSMGDFDMLEDGFCKLKQAKVILADYDLLKKDFPELGDLDSSQIDQWLLDNCAYISEGQAARL